MERKSIKDDNDALWFLENGVDTMNVSDINCPNENNGTTMPVINDVKEWIRSPWTQDVCFFYHLYNIIVFYCVNVLFIFIPMFDLMLKLFKNNLNENKNNFRTAVLI